MDTLIFTGWTGLSRMLMLAFHDIPTVSSSVSVQDISANSYPVNIICPENAICFAAL